MLAPLRWLLRAFSSITLSVALLSLIAIYGTLASVPIGLLALGPTWAVIALAVVLSASLPAVLIGAGVRRCLQKPRHGLRFAATLIGGLFGAVGGAWAWRVWAWPALRFDPVSGNGMRLFAGFVERYEDITLRRLPGIELTELEFYAAWPFKLLLILFVTNMVVATVRRIEFGVKNAGVLAVHSGIVLIAMSSLYYQALKQEGDTILLAGAQLADGTSARGPAQTHFYDATRVAIWTPRTQWGYGYAKERIVVYAFGLTPLGLGALLGSDQPMMPNQIYALEYPSELRDILQAARQQRFDDWYALVSDRLTKVFRHVDPTPAVTDEALELLSIDGGGAVSSAAGLMGLSTRQFRRRFLRSFGMTPKRYQRLTRVDRMLRQLHPRAWESDAFAGEPVAFADQPHAIREFKEATGVTPSVYLASKRAGDRTLRSLAVESSVAAPVESEKDA